jgi:glycosyltransferase involved in cell wall biosynthesis
MSTEHEQFSVSVIVPVYNGEAFLREAIQSIRGQDWGTAEIIVVDDGSTDRTAEIVTGLGDTVRYVQQTNLGAAAARNRGIRMATGSVIAFLDADDLWLEHTLSLQLKMLRADPSLQMVRGHTQRIRRAAGRPDKSCWENFGDAWPALSLGSAVMRKPVFDSVGYLDESLAFNEDVDWFLRARETGIATMLHGNLVQLYRRHEHNLTNNRTLNKTSFLRTLKNTIERKRNNEE